VCPILFCPAVLAVGGAASESSRHLELRCVLAVIRHGDRTPKQKMKVTVTQVRLQGGPRTCLAATALLAGRRHTCPQVEVSLQR